MGKYPPLLPKLRPVIAGLRVVGIVVLIGSVWIGTSYFQDDETLTGIRAIVGGLAFAVATWLSPYSPLFLALLILPIIVFPITSGSGILFLVIAIVSLLWLTWRRGQPVSIDPVGVRQTDDDAVMPHAMKFVAEFEESGWTRQGAIAADLGSINIVLTVLVSPDGVTYAEVTDVVIALTSVFPHGRTLVTRNSASSPLEEWVLANDHRGANPTQLATSHDRVLKRLKTNGVIPISLRSPRLIDFVVEQEKMSIESTSGFRPKVTDTGKGSGPVDDSEKSAERIRQWIYTTGRDLTGLLAPDTG